MRHPRQHTSHASKQSLKRSAKSLALTLSRAEERHLLDCPNAEFGIRSAALVLDCIFFFLASSGLESLCNTLAVHLAHLPIPDPNLPMTSISEISLWITRHAGRIAAYLHLILKVSLFFFYFTWSVAFAGGTPAKLLFGLRVIDNGSGSYLDYPRTFFRETLGKLIGLLLMGYGFGRVLLNKDRLALHDLWSDSVVKRVHGVR